MTSRRRKILLSIGALFMLALAVLLFQRQALLQDYSFGQIAFVSYGKDTSTINLMDADGAHLASVRSAVGSSDVCCPAWSPDGQQLAYAVERYESIGPVSTLDSINLLNPTNGQETSTACRLWGEAKCEGRGVRSLQWTNGGKCFHWITKDSLMYFEKTIPAANFIDTQDEHQCKPFAPYLHQYAIGLSRELTYSPDRRYYLEAMYHQQLNKFESFLVSTSGMSLSLGLKLVTSFAWSPNSSHLAFTMADIQSSDQAIRSLYLLRIADSATSTMTANLDVKGNPT